MKRKLSVALFIVGTLCVAGHLVTIAAHPGAHDKNAFTPDTIPWGPPPPFVAPGAQLAVLEGNPAASTGDYTVRLKMPDGYRIAPHWHPQRENVTVISGTFKVGMGDTFEQDKMGSFPPAASPISIPTCITTRWLPAKSSCRSTAARPCSLTMSIPQTTRARSKSLAL